ncbi:MerR family transcriptional regulator [Occultella aeris]|uniref:HTH-type transcriptional regulator AdhR n=1 Tax=Occultella aeris TaxID=2761496 RepID=A0A7M4DLL9_9MICO|nr:MerR family transcriptional regulator [Occultella aeris]VZO38190.1 HTH-type transcriptional regulator AdhR [Occultella aeris]
MATYTPAETEARSGFSIGTLRYYERVGLLYDIARDTSGRRVFTDRDLEWLEILRCLRDTGMPIAQMQRYADLTVNDGSVDERLEILRQHDDAVTEQMAQLRRWRRHLRDKIAYYEGVQEQAPPGPDAPSE